MTAKHLKNYFRPAVLRMKGYVPGEQPRDPRIVKLNTNENPYPPSAAVRRAVGKAAGERLRLYPEPASDGLRRSIASAYRWPLEGILVGNGSDEILSILFSACVGKGDRVQYPDLTYSLYPVLAALREAKVTEVELDEDLGLPFSKFSRTARLTLFGHPNPPVGNCFPQAAIRGFCRKAKGLVLIDEAYVDFSKRDCSDIARSCPNVLLLRTLSKSFSLAGIRLGFALGHPSVIGQLMKVKDSYNVNRVTQAAGLAALGPAGLKDMKGKVRRIVFERNSLIESIRDLGFTVPDSQANFFLAIRRGAPSAENLYKALKRKGVLVRYFSHPRLRSSLRVTVGAPEQNRRLLSALKELLEF